MSEPSGTTAAADMPDPVFEVTEFRPDGGYTSKGSGLLLISSMLAGAALGALASYVSQWFYLIVLFPLVIGFGVGGVGMWAIKQGKIRSPMLGGLAGLLAGVFASVAMHYGDYVQFQRERDAVPEHIRQIAGLIGERAPNVQPLNPPPVKPGDPPVKPLDKALLADLQELGKQMKVTNFFEYVDYAAHVGVSLKRAGHGDQGMNLGYIGTYIYWIVEALIVALVALAMTHKSASEPFCTACERWKTSHTLGSVLGSPQDVLDVLRSGHPGRLRLHQPTSNPGELAFTVWECPKCEAAAPFEIKLQHVTQSAKNETRTKDLGCFTYPGEALPVLEAMFQPVVEEVQTADGEKPKTDAAASS